MCTYVVTCSVYDSHAVVAFFNFMIWVTVYSIIVPCGARCMVLQVRLGIEICVPTI